MAFKSVYDGAKVLITGHTGFKGCWISTWLIKLGADVYGVSDEVFESPSLFSALRLEDKLTHLLGDIRDQDVVSKAIDEIKPDFVFHLAAQSIVSLSYTDPLKTFSTNVLGTLNVLEALRKVEHKCCAVLITSDKCYHNSEWIWGYRETDQLGGKDPYSSSKAAAEILIRSCFDSFFNTESSPIRLVSARAGNVIGGGDWKQDRVVPDAVRAWSEDQPVTIRAPKSTRPWQHVLEPLSGYLTAGEALHSGMPVHGEAYNFGPQANQDKTVRDLLLELAETWGPESCEPINIEENRTFSEAGLLKLNCDKALANLSWNSVLNFQECAIYTASWYRSFYEGNEAMFDFTEAQIDSYEGLARQRQLNWSKE